MQKKIKTTIILLFLLVIGNPLFAISPTGTVTGIGASPKIGSNIFPVNSTISYDIYNFNFIENYPTNMKLNIKGGYSTRSVGQDPISGLASWCDNYSSSEHGKMLWNSYGIIYSGWESVFTQPLPLPKSIPGKFNIWMGTSVHYEQAIDKLEIFRKEDPYASTTIFDKLQTYAPTGTTLHGTPDLEGNRYLHDFSINFGSKYSHSIFNIPYSFSISANLSPSLTTKYSPSYIINEKDDFDGKTNYFRISPSFYASKTLYSKKYNDLFTKNDMYLLRVVASNSLSYRYLKGSAVPQYKNNAGNLNHYISNSLALTVYGPQVLAPDIYPWMQVSYSPNYKWGKLNNTDPKEYNNESYDGQKFNHSINLKFELRIIGIIHFGYKSSYNLITNTYKPLEQYFYVQL